MTVESPRVWENVTVGGIVFGRDRDWFSCLGPVRLD